MRYEFFVRGVPKGQPRVKAYARGGRAGVYDPGTANDWKMQVRMAGAPHRPKEPLEGPVELNVWFVFRRPKSHFRANGALKENAPGLHTHKPDIDNAIKALADAMTDDGWWRDDSQIWRVVAARVWVGGSFGIEGAHVQILA